MEFIDDYSNMHINDFEKKYGLTYDEIFGGFMEDNEAINYYLKSKYLDKK